MRRDEAKEGHGEREVLRGQGLLLKGPLKVLSIQRQLRQAGRLSPSSQFHQPGNRAVQGGGGPRQSLQPQRFQVGQQL